MSQKSLLSFLAAAVLLAAASPASHAQTALHTAVTLPDAPSALLTTPDADSSSLTPVPDIFADPQQTAAKPQQKEVELDADGKPIPLNRQQPKRILGFMPNFRSVSAGAVVHPPGWKYNFKITTRQAFDYSSFLFLGLTTISAEGIDSHPVLGKGVDGFYAYLWRGLIDKTDGVYIQGWLLPSLLHEDTRYYPMGSGHRIITRALYVISRQAVTRTYGGHQTPNISGLGGKVLTQIISRTYYPTGATSFGVLATKFGYSAMRDVGFTSVREFYPDVAAHYIRKHREKQAAAQALKDANDAHIPTAPVAVHP